MHAIKGGWSGQVFALASDNELGGRKSRIRRSKEERKAMVESFIKKYQKSNGGNFPSLNLTHKEVGGSFYIVREIVREIIQENRVLAPPKLLEDDSGFLEQFPLGSISMEPQMDLLGSDRIHMATHSTFNEYQIASEDISNSNLEFIVSSTLELDKEQVNEIGKITEGEAIPDGASSGHHASNHYQDMKTEDVLSCGEESTQLQSHEFENGKIVNGVELLEGNLQSNKPVVTDVADSVLLSIEKISAPGTQMPVQVQSQDEPVGIIDKTREFSERISQESVSVKILDSEKNGAHYVAASQAVASHMNSDVVVEKFPLRPFPRTIYDEDGGSMEVHGSAKVMDNKAIRHDPTTLTQNPSGHVNEKGATVACVLNVDGATILDHQKSFPNQIQVNTSTKHSIPENSTAVGKKFHDCSSKGNNPNPETSTKSSIPEDNPLVALLKGIISFFHQILE